MTFEEFVSARLDDLVRYATVVTWDPHLAEDISQTVLVKASTRWNRIGRLDAPEYYLKRMIVNEFLSWRRRLSSRTVPLPKESLEAAQQPAPDPTTSRDERDAMLRLIGTLPPRQRAVLALRYYEDMSVADVAEFLGCRPVTVRTHTSRALATLRGLLPASTVSTGDRK